MQLSRRHIEILGILSPSEPMTIARIGTRLPDLKESSWASVIGPHITGLVTSELARVVEGRPRLYFRTEAGSARYLKERGCASDKSDTQKSSRAGLKIGESTICPVRAHPLVRQFRDARIAAGMTVAHVSARSGYAAPGIHSMETGDSTPNVAKFADLCEVVGLRLCVVPSARGSST